MKSECQKNEQVHHKVLESFGNFVMDLKPWDSYGSVSHCNTQIKRHKSMFLKDCSGAVK